MPNFLQNAAPTIGGILGGIGGGLAGIPAAVATGGILNPFDLGVAGAAAGGGIGQGIKNASMGQNPIQANDLGAAAAQGGGQLIGGALGHAAGGLLGGLGEATGNAAKGMFMHQFGGALDTRPIAALGTDAATALHEGMGLSDASIIPSLADKVSGPNGAINQGVIRGLDETGMGVDLSKMQPFANNLINQNGQWLEGTSANKLSQQVNDSLLAKTNAEDTYGVPGTKKGVGQNIIEPAALQNVPSVDAFNMMQDYENQAKIAGKAAFDLGGGIKSQDAYGKYQVYNGIADNLRSMTAGTTALSPENKAQIIQDLGQIKQISPSAYTWLSDKVNGATTLQDLRSIEAPIVRGSMAAQTAAVKNSAQSSISPKSMLQTISSVVGLAQKNPVEKALGAAGLAAELPGSAKVGSSVLGRMTNVLTNDTLNKALPVAGGAAGNVAAGVPGYTLGTGDASMMPAGQMQPGMAGQAGTAPSPEMAQMMMGMLGMATDPWMSSQFSPMITGAVPTLQHIATAQAALPGLQQNFQQGGGGGILSLLQGLLPGTAANLYNRQAGQLQNTLGGLGAPSTVMPSLMTGGNLANQRFSQLQQMLGQMGGQGVLAGV